MTALALSVRDALRSGTLYLPDSRRYVSFWNLVYQENEWQKERDNSYRTLSLELAKWLFFANHGEFRTGDYEEIMNKASCLSILSNAALIWNTIEIGKIVDQLRLGGAEINDENIAGISPLLFRHIIPNGTYYFKEDNEGDTIALNTLE